jgi:lysophospholipase L1-like esterase
MKNGLDLKILTALTLASSANIQAKVPLPKTMAAIGDSITAGALAMFSRKDAHDPVAFPKFLYYIGKIGFTASLHAMESRERSWSSGEKSNKVQTHADRLQAMAEENGSEIKIYNAAVSGAASKDIKAQVDAVLKWSKSNGQRAPDYITLLIGPNDACAKTNDEMTSKSEYSNNLRNAVYTILEANPKSHILISGIPNLEHLHDVAQNSSLTGLPPTAKCKDIWKIHKFCNNMLTEQDPEKRHEVTQRIKEYMSEAKKITRDANADFGDDQVRFVSEIYDYKFSDNQISFDCFHPDYRGHQALSDLSWKRSWWADK